MRLRLGSPKHNNQTAKQRPQKLLRQRCRLSAAAVAASASAATAAVVVAAAVAGGGSGGGSGGGNSSGRESGSSGGSGRQRRRRRRWQRQRHVGGRGSGSGDVGGGGRGSGGSSHHSFIPNPLFPHTRESVQMKKTQKSSIFIYGTTNRTKRIWTEYLASPDLEQSLTKTKKKLVSTNSCALFENYYSNFTQSLKI
jgi:hypothetical protein